MLEIHDAYQIIAETLEALTPKAPTFSLETGKSLGFVLAQTVNCHLDSPPFDQAAMDGVAFAHEPGKTSYRLAGVVAAGDIPDRVLPRPGECVRIMTGAPVPSTVDTVEMIEKLSIEGETVALKENVTQGQHIRFCGENLKRGARLYEPGLKIGPGILAGLISQGVREVLVRQPLRVGIASTGDEIIDYRLPLEPGQIYNSNAPALGALLASNAVSVSLLGAFPDDLERIQKCLAINTDLDVLILSGGVSMGAYDLVPEAAKRAGFREIFHKVKMKPGKPLWFGAARTGTLLFGLPGNPVSALAGALLFIQPVLNGLVSGRFELPAWGRVSCGETMTNKGGLTHFVGVRLQRTANETVAVPLQTSGSGDVLRFSPFETLAKLPPTTEIERGRPVEILLSLPQGFG